VYVWCGLGAASMPSLWLFMYNLHIAHLRSILPLSVPSSAVIVRVCGLFLQPGCLCPCRHHHHHCTTCRAHGAPPEVLRWFIDHISGEGALLRKAQVRTGPDSRQLGRGCAVMGGVAQGRAACCAMCA
jgi:hypothetical protein